MLQMLDVEVGYGRTSVIHGITVEVPPALVRTIGEITSRWICDFPVRLATRSTTSLRTAR